MNRKTNIIKYANTPFIYPNLSINEKANIEFINVPIDTNNITNIAYPISPLNIVFNILLLFIKFSESILKLLGPFDIIPIIINIP